MTPATIRALIIDDEKHVRESLTSLLSIFCPEVQVIATSNSISSATKLIKSERPDLIFLDIALGEESGFDLLDVLKPIEFQIIFITAHNEFATTAFRYNAVDYLLKPIVPAELQEAIQKFQQVNKTNLLEEKLVHLLNAFKSQRNNTMTISTSEGIHFIDIENIVRIKGDGAYASIFLDNNEQITASKNLRHFERLLPSNQFFRPHQSHLVNINYIKKIKSREGGAIELKNGLLIPLVKHKKDTLISLLSS